MPKYEVEVSFRDKDRVTLTANNEDDAKVRVLEEMLQWAPEATELTVDNITEVVD